MKVLRKFCIHTKCMMTPRGYFTGPSLRESTNDSHMASETWQLTEISVDLVNCLRFLGFPYLLASDYGYNTIQFLQLCCKQSTTVNKALAKYKAVNLFYILILIFLKHSGTCGWKIMSYNFVFKTQKGTFRKSVFFKLTYISRKLAELPPSYHLTVLKHCTEFL